MYLCVCKAVREREVRELLKNGRCRSAEEVRRHTGAATGCGMCMAALVEMVEEEEGLRYPSSGERCAAK